MDYPMAEYLNEVG